MFARRAGAVKRYVGEVWRRTWTASSWWRRHATVQTLEAAGSKAACLGRGDLHKRRPCNPCFWEVEIRNSQDAEASHLVSAIIPAAYQTLTSPIFPCTIPALSSQPTLPRREYRL